MTDVATFYQKVRVETCKILGFKLKRLTPEQTMRLDCAVALRLALDDLQGRVIRGETVDVAKMLTASEALARILPPEVLATQPDAARPDPRVALFEELQRMAERGELYEAEQEARESERLAQRVAELEAELAALKGGAPAPAEPAPPAGDNVVVISRAPSTPAAQHATPAKPFVNGSSDVPRHVRDTRPANEPWRDYVGPDGDISMRPLAGGSRERHRQRMSARPRGRPRRGLR